MSSNTPETGSAPQPSLNAIIHPSLNSAMIAHTFLTLLIPLAISLFYFSTTQSRRRPIFSLNLLAILLAFANGVLIDAVSIHAVLEPLNQWPIELNISIGFIGVWQSILVDLALLIRLVSVYPPSQVGSIFFSLLIAIPVLLKLTRVVNIILFAKAMIDAMSGPNSSVIMGIIFTSKPYLKIEWAAQMIDNTYASLAFLWKIHHHSVRRVTTTSSKVTLGRHVQTLFRIATTNFVVPAMFSIAQFVSVYRGVDVAVLNQLILVNTMVATFGVAFATVWAGNISRKEAEDLESKRNNSTSGLVAMFGLGTRRGPSQSSTAMVTGSRYTTNPCDKVKV